MHFSENWIVHLHYTQFFSFSFLVLHLHYQSYQFFSVFFLVPVLHYQNDQFFSVFFLVPLLHYQNDQCFSFFCYLVDSNQLLVESIDHHLLIRHYLPSTLWNFFLLQRENLGLKMFRTQIFHLILFSFLKQLSFRGICFICFICFASFSYILIICCFGILWGADWNITSR